MGVIAPRHPQDGCRHREDIPAEADREIATWIPIDQGLIPARDRRRHGHDLTRRDLEVEVPAGAIEEDFHVESRAHRCEVGGGEARVIPAIPATAIEAGAEVVAGMDEAETDGIIGAVAASLGVSVPVYVPFTDKQVKHLF